MWAQSTELQGAGPGKVGEGQAQGVFPAEARGKAKSAEPGREGIGAGCEGSKWLCRWVRTECQAFRDLPEMCDGLLVPCLTPGAVVSSV